MDDFSANHGDTEDAGSMVGHQIRELRRTRGLTLSDMARNTKRSIGYLSQVERGVSPVNITTLQCIAGALGVSINFFFMADAEADPAERDVVVRRGARKRLDFAGSGVREELLSPSLDAQIELILTTFAPGCGTGESPRHRKGEEAGLVISGILEIEAEERTYRLDTGDSFALKPGGAHRCRNPADAGGMDAVIVWAITPPSY